MPLTKFDFTENGDGDVITAELKPLFMLKSGKLCKEGEKKRERIDKLRKSCRFA